ncbi:NAD(P)H-hydrate epimerase [Bordetella sp. 2513F-2]
MRLTLGQIRRIEQLALARGLPLMARAGEAAAGFLAARVPVPGPVLALAGPGNNGGDAVVAATRLRERGYDVLVAYCSDPEKLPPDARQAHAAWHRAGGTVLPALPDRPPACVIDGLFGIGLARPLQAGWQQCIDTVNGWGVPVLALDVPSGLAADGRLLGAPIRATWTLSFIAPAPGLDAPDARRCSGETHLATLDIPPDLLAAALRHPD